jgi:pilus assembly protein Flp/PilA
MMWTVMPYVLRAVEWMKSPLKRQEGQGLVEYALILVLVALVIITALVLLGGRLGQVFGSINAGIDPTGVSKTATALAS